MDPTTAYQGAIKTYVAAVSSLQTDITIIIGLFGAALAIITILSWILQNSIKNKSDAAEQKMQQAEELSRKANTQIEELSEIQKQVSNDQKSLNATMDELQTLISSKEVEEKLKEIDNIKTFMIQTKEKMDCDDLLKDAEMRLDIINQEPFNNMVSLNPKLYNQYQELKTQLEHEYATVRYRWDNNSLNKNEAREECKNLNDRCFKLYQKVMDSSKASIQGKI